MNRTLPLLLLTTLTVGLAACSKPADAPKPAETAAATAATPAAEPAVATPAVTRKPAPAGAKVFFVDLKDGAEVTSPVTVKFGVEGATVSPAADGDKPDSGHHHLIVDADLPNQDAPLPANDNVIHFGKGQTETSLTLAPGKHTLQLEFADYSHVPFNPPVVSDKITITVK
jgi:hypothetical protein